MRYGHLLGGLILIIFLAFLGIALSRPHSMKIDVASSPNAAASRGSVQAPPGYYTEPTGSSARIVTYSESGFSPQTLAVAPGTTVIFQNNTSVPFWPVAAVSGGYPQGGGCGNSKSAFDACAPIAPSSSWSFKFDKIGNWKYLDATNPAHTGIIIVK